jgi:hypothetical protein
MKDIVIRYLRDKDRRPYGCVVAVLVYENGEHKGYIGWSQCRRGKDHFNKKEAKKYAIQRALGLNKELSLFPHDRKVTIWADGKEYKTTEAHQIMVMVFELAATLHKEWKEYTMTALVELIGGFHCYLTIDEANAHREFMLENETFQKYCAILAQLDAAELIMEEPDDVDLALLIVEGQKLERELFKISKQWYQDLKAKRLAEIKINMMPKEELDPENI